MQNYLESLIEDVWQERSLILLLFLTDEGILKQSRFTSNETILFKNLALEKSHGQKTSKKYYAINF